MNVAISEAIRELARILTATSESLEKTLNTGLNQLLGTSFSSVSGVSRDTEGQQTEYFGTLVFRNTSSGAPSETVSADDLACVIDSTDKMEIAFLQTAYERIASAKKLKKAAAPGTSAKPQTTVTLGVILARDATVPLDVLAQELDRLNRLHPESEWTDMVVVLSKGTINYAVQFPGDTKLGDFLPPAPGAFDRGSPPIYVVVVIRASGSYTLNRILAFLIGHLRFFSPSATLPDYLEVVHGVPTNTITLCGYQYNLDGRLMPVPRQYYNDRYLPERPFLVEDLIGNLLATLQFIPWQDGGVVMLRGKLPLEGLLIFFGREALKRGGIVNTPSGFQLSYVLPIGKPEFVAFLQRLQKQSNMIVRLDSTKYTVQQLMDEGTTSPFVARLYLGNLRLRDIVFPDPVKRQEFDKAYESVMTNVLNARTAAREISKILTEHSSKLLSGELAEVRGYTLHIRSSIDKDLQRELANFLNSAVRAIKEGMQKVANSLNVSIGSLFKKDSTFEARMLSLEQSDTGIAAYLRATRHWSERLQKCRNASEHEGWTLPKVIYEETNGVVSMREPQISGQAVSVFVDFMMDRLCCFVEELTAECLKRLMPTGISITEIPLAERDPEVPERFRITLTYGGMPVWNITAHTSSFQKT
jgi:hypothetical protein